MLFLTDEYGTLSDRIHSWLVRDLESPDPSDSASNNPDDTVVELDVEVEVNLP